MKNQTLFSSKDKSKKLKYRLLHFLFAALGLMFVYSKLFQHCVLNIIQGQN